MQSVDEFTPSTTEPVFGSGLVSQKVPTSTNNDVSDNEKAIPPSDSTVNGENKTAIKSNENIANGKTENVGTSDSSTVQVNGQHETTTIEISNDIKSIGESEKTIEQIEPDAQPEPVSSTPMETANEPSSTTVDLASVPPVAESTSTSEVAVESTSTPVDEPAPTESASEIPVATASEAHEPKGKSPRTRAVKTPIATPTPIRQSTRARKPASTSNGDETTPIEPSISITPIETPTPSSSTTTTTTPQRSKRQAIPIAQEPIGVNNQPTSTNEIDNEKTIHDEPIEGEIKGSPGKKRAASKSSSNSTKKVRGKTSVTSSNDVDNEPVESTVETTIITPPKKVRTSATKKTPEPPSEEYVRKLRPRK